MKPKQIFSCQNKDCVDYGREHQLHYTSFFGSTKEGHSDDYWMAQLKHCRTCYRTGRVKIEHGSRVFSDLDAFEEYILGIAKEAKLLKKLVGRGVADDEEKQQQLDEALKLVANANCLCCGQLLINTMETGTNAKV